MSYKWIIAVVCGVGISVGLAPVFYNTLPVFTLSIARSTGWGRASIASAISAATLMGALTSPFLGRLIDRFGPRRIIACSAVLFGASLIALGGLPLNYATYIGLAILIGLFGNGVGVWVYLSILPRWFNRNLGLSLGIASAGTGLGQVVTPLLASALISAVGWQHAYVALGLLAIVVALICVSLLRDKPAAMRSNDAEISPVAVVEGMSRGQAMRTPTCWRLIAAVVLITITVAGCMLSMVPFLQDHGLRLQLAVQVAATAGLAGMFGRLLTGFILDHANPSLVSAATFLIAAVSAVLFWADISVELFFVAAALLGVALGAEGDVIAYLTRRAFGTRTYGELYGYVWAAFNVGALLGPLLMGLSYDIFRSYDPALLFMIASALFAALLILPDTAVFKPSHLEAAEPSSFK